VINNYDDKNINEQEEWRGATELEDGGEQKGEWQARGDGGEE